MSATTNEESLAALRRQAEAAQQRYMQTLGEIKAKRTQLDEAMTALNNLGCTSLAEAEQLAADLQERMDTQLAEIGRLLG